MEDAQVEDELPNPELGSPAPAPPEDLAQDIPPRHSTRVRSIPTYLLIILGICVIMGQRNFKTSSYGQRGSQVLTLHQKIPNS